MARHKNDGRGRMGGRQKGTPNKSTSTIREAIAAQWQRYQDSGQFEQDIDALDPATRVAVMEKLAQYTTPKMKSIDMDMTVAETSETIIDRLTQLVSDDDN